MKKRSGFQIMARLIGLVRPLAGYMVLAVVMGLIGMAILLLIYPLFQILHNHLIVVAWIYTFTVMVVLTFAIEIGQKITGTGRMEFDDIVSGLAGFMAMFLVFALIRGIFLFIRWLIRRVG